MTQRKAISDIAAWIFILTIAVCGALMTYVTIPQSDDAIGYSQSKELLDSLGLQYNFPDILYIFDDNLHNTNGRISTPLAILLLTILPSWAMALLNGASIFLCLTLIYKVAVYSFNTKRINKSTIILLIGILSLLSLQWNDSMFLILFAATYIWHTVLLLICALVFLKLLLPKGNIPAVFVWLSIPLMVLTGNWQEGSALCLIGPLCVMALLVPRRNLPAYIVLLTFFIIGVLTNILSPGLSSRVGKVQIVLNIFNWFQPYTLTRGIWLCPQNVLPLIFVSVSILILIFKHRLISSLYHNCIKAGFQNFSTIIPVWWKTELLCFLVTATNLALGLFFCSPRVAFIGNVFAIIGISQLALHYVPRINSHKIRCALNIFFCLIATLLFTNMMLSIKLQQRVSQDHETITRLLISSPDGTVYYDPLTFPHYPHYPWQWVLNSFYVDTFSLNSLLYHPLIDKPLRLIPTVLRNIPASTIINEPILYDGHWISSSEPKLPQGSKRTVIFPDTYPFLKINAVVETASGREEIRFFEIIPFTTGKGTPNQRDLYYFRPVWYSHAEIADPAVKILSVSPAKYW